MKKEAFSHSESRFLLIIILLVASFLRFYHLGFQSLWLDEIATGVFMHESTTWHKFFDYFNYDPELPLFYIVEKGVFILFSGSEIALRMVSSIAGVISVFGIYLLGKDLFNKRTGLTAASLLCVNYMAIWHSQDARPYSLLLMLSIFSFLYLIKSIRNLHKKDIIIYTIFTIAMLYTHYYGAFAFASQVVIVLIFLSQAENKKCYFILFSITGIFIVLTFLPWLFLFSNTALSITSFWIQRYSPLYILRFFCRYFVKDYLVLELLMACILTIGFIQVLLYAHKEKGNLKERKLSSLLLFCFTWIFITFLLPYIYSLIKIPILIIRYTIIVLPAVIIILSAAIELIRNPVKRIVAFCLVIFVSSIFIFQLGFYSSPSKTQYRELATYIMSDTIHNKYPYIAVPVLPTVREHQYYLQKYNYSGNMVVGDKRSCDSLVHDKNTTGFWLIRAHENKHWNPEMPSDTDSLYMLLKKKAFVDADAKLYIRKSSPQEPH